MLTRRTFIASTGALTMGIPNLLKAAPSPLASIGLIADAQYADVEAEKTRFYRQSIGKLGAAVEQLNRQELACCLHLGDLTSARPRICVSSVIPLAGDMGNRGPGLLGTPLPPSCTPTPGQVWSEGPNRGTE